MERNEFDRMLRDRLEGVTEPAPDVWEGISRGLARRHRRVLLRNFATGAVAAAAGLAVALLVFRGPQAARHVEAPMRTAHAVESVQPAAPAPADMLEVAPIATQIANFTKHQVVAQAVVPKPAAPQTVADAVVSDETPVAPAQEQPAVETPAANTPVVQPTEPTEPQQRQLTEDDLPADFWREDVPAPKTHTSNLSILSNITTVGSEGDLIYKASPMHSSSQTGNRAASAVEPVSGTPKFFSPLSLGLQVELPLSGPISVATGLTYSYLVSQYDILVDKVRYEGAYNQLHYVGIPLSLNWHFVETPSFGFYASAGGAVEKCVSQRYIYGHEQPKYEKVAGLQWSARVGLGAEYWVAPRVGLYFDPSLVYFFDNHQPLSIRTQQPLQARFEVGLRFKL